MLKTRENLIEKIERDIITYLANEIGEYYKEIVVILNDNIIESLGLEYIVPNIYDFSNVGVCQFVLSVLTQKGRVVSGNVYITILNSFRKERYIYLEEAYTVLFLSGVDITPFIDNLAALFKNDENRLEWVGLF